MRLAPPLSPFFFLVDRVADSDAGIVYNVFEAVDVIALIKGGVYDDLSLNVGEALKKRSPVRCFSPFSHI